jgi:hypothetical protein
VSAAIVVFDEVESERFETLVEDDRQVDDYQGGHDSHLAPADSEFQF